MLVKDAVTTYLGPASVVATRGLTVTVELREGLEAEARLALAFPYAPVEGDLLLVIGTRGVLDSVDAAAIAADDAQQSDAYYVIGVLHGTGHAVFNMQGDVALHAVNGELALRGDKGVRIDGPDVAVTATRGFTMVAETVTESAGRVTRWVRDLLSIRAGRRKEDVATTASTTAAEVRVTAEGDVRINGGQIHLG